MRTTESRSFSKPELMDARAGLATEAPRSAVAAKIDRESDWFTMAGFK